MNRRLQEGEMPMRRRLGEKPGQRLGKFGPLPTDVAAAFRDYLNGRSSQTPLWPGKWNEKAAEMVRGDLAVAGISYRDSEGNVADFHALKHSYVSLLGRMGIRQRSLKPLRAIRISD